MSAASASFLIGPGLPLDETVHYVPAPGSPGAPADPQPVVAPTPTVEYAAAYGERPTLSALVMGKDGWGWAFCRQKHEVHRAMMRHPVVSSSLDALKAAALAGGLKLTAAVTPDADGNGEVDPDAALAAEVLAECRDYLARLEFTTPIASFLWEHLDAVAEGHKLAEVVMEPDPTRPNRLRLARVKHKPRWAYRFAVDPTNEVVGVDVYSAEDNEWARLDPGKFVWSTWNARSGDPRGNSALDPAYLPWTQLVKLMPFAQEGWETFGEPIIYGTVGEDEHDIPATKPGEDPTPAVVGMARAMARLKGNAKVAGAYGSKIQVIESQRDGSAMLNGLGYLEGLVVRTILLQVRATVEAKHGSRADSQTGENILLTLATIVREFACVAARKILRAVVEANRGPEVADRLTPKASLGQIAPGDLLTFAQAIALLFNSGYFAESMLADCDAMLGFTPRNPDAERVGPAKSSADGETSGDAEGAGEGDAAAPNQNEAIAAAFAKLRADVDKVIAAKGDIGQGVAQ